jgi:ribosome-associated toxin RatA of RatAB toxin-antitoxin module
MKWLLLIAGIFTLVAFAVLILGLLQPVKHSVTRSIHLKQKPDTVFALLDNIADQPNWSSTVMKVEPLPDRNGKPVARYTLKWGGRQMIMTQLEHKPPTRLVATMAKEGGPILGTWTYQVVAERDGCRVSVTEEGELKNPFFRAIAGMRGLDANITQTLRDLANNFGERADISILVP